MKTQILIVISLIIFSVSSQQLKYKTIDITPEQVQQKCIEQAIQTVQERANLLSGSQCTDTQLVSKQVVAGMIYEYKLTFVDPSGANHCYLVSVWTKPWENFYEVKSYKDVDCTENIVSQKNLMAGGYNPYTFDPSGNPNDQLVYNALVSYMASNNAGYTVTSVTSAEKQVVAGFNVRLTFNVSNGQSNQQCVAVVWAQPWLNQASVTSFSCN